MASCDALRYDLLLYCKLVYIFKLFHKALNDGLPELLSKDIYTKHCNGYSLLGKDCLLVPRFNTDEIYEGLARSLAHFYGTLLVLMKMEHHS